MGPGPVLGLHRRSEQLNHYNYNAEYQRINNYQALHKVPKFDGQGVPEQVGPLLPSILEGLAFQVFRRDGKDSKQFKPRISKNVFTQFSF